VKVVLDTNVFVASFFNPKGYPKKVIDLWKKGEIILCLCAEILEEYVEVLSRLGLEGEPEMRELLGLFKKRINLEFVAIDGSLQLILEDPDDNKFIECALNAHADVVISGDKHLKELKRYKEITILSPADFIESYTLHPTP
jgi:hypothetical protein